MNETEEEQYALEVQLRQAEEAKMSLEDDEVLNLLSAEQQLSLLDTIIENSQHQDVVDYVTIDKITENITFDNVNLVVHRLANYHQDVFAALLEEAKYYER